MLARVILVQGWTDALSVTGRAVLHTQPPTVACKMKAQLECACTMHARLATIRNAQSVTINKISVLELSRKFVKSALLVGYVHPLLNSPLGTHKTFCSRNLAVLELPLAHMTPPGGGGGAEAEAKKNMSDFFFFELTKF